MANYVEKARLHEELIQHLANVKQAEALGQPPPRPSDFIGNAIIKIANGLANKHNFRNYTWKDEMISDGVLAAVRAINKYDPVRMTQNGEPNPYGYFTQCIYWEFIARINNEKKQNDIKVEILKDVSDEIYFNGEIDATQVSLIAQRERVIELFED